MMACGNRLSNFAVEQTAGAHALAAAAHRGRYPDCVVSCSCSESVMRMVVSPRDVRVGSGQGCGKRQEAPRHVRGGRIGVPRPVGAFWDPDHSEEENREITIGRSARRRVLFVAHAAREGRVRIISATGEAPGAETI